MVHPNNITTLIIGGGPAGLTLATYMPGNVILIEREATLGGCHRVRRDDEGYFSEHGPRVYNACYVNTKNVLEHIGLTWSEVFTPTPFSPEHIDGKHWYQWFSVRESFILTWQYLIYALWNKQYGKNVTMSEFCTANAFSPKSSRYIDHICRFSDGAGAGRYTLWEFLSGLDQHLYRFYEPRTPLDQGVFAHWESFLKGRGVDLRLGTTVKKLMHKDGVIVGVELASGEKIRASRVVCAIPPAPMDELLRRSHLHEPGFHEFAERTEYDEYLSVCYHFPLDESPLLDHREGITSTPWGVLARDLSQSMAMETACLSVAATQLDVPSPTTGKTARHSSKEEVIDEILRQLPLRPQTKRRLVKAVMSSGLHKPTSSSWEDEDEAYVATARTTPQGPALQCCSNLFSVGCHNGQSWYHFTSMEAAIENALAFLGNPRDYTLSLSDYVHVILIVGVGLGLVRFFIS